MSNLSLAIVVAVATILSYLRMEHSNGSDWPLIVARGFVIGAIVSLIFLV